MPTYDLACACGHAWELFRFKPLKSDLLWCTKCHKRTARVQVGGGAAAMCKGSGFYSTDNRTDGYRTKSTLNTMGTKHSERVSKAGLVKRTTRDQG